MKSLSFVMLLLLTLVSRPAWSQDAGSVNTVTIGIKGMVCAFCSAGLKKTFKKIVGVTKVDVSLEKKSLVLTVDETFVLTDDAVKERVKDTGFEASDVKRSSSQ